MSAFEVGMRLDPVDDNDPVRVECDLVAVHGNPVIEGCNAHHLHGRDHGHPHRLFGDPVSRQHLPLALRVSPTVASHCGDDEGPCPPRGELLDQRAQDEGELSDVPASRGERDLFPSEL